MFLLVTSTLGGGGGYPAVYSVLSGTAGKVLGTTLVPIIGLIRPKDILQLTVSQHVRSFSWSGLYTVIIGMMVSPNKGGLAEPRRPSLSEVKQPKIHP